jgi:hypothetical protein
MARPSRFSPEVRERAMIRVCRHPAHDRGLKTFRELTPAQMRAAIAAQASHLKKMQRVYREVKKTRLAR